MCSLKIGSKIIELPIIQGGMGVDVSTPEMAAAVSREGGLGVLSATLSSYVASFRKGKLVTAYEAVKESVIKAKSLSGDSLLGMNIMMALPQGFQESIRGAIDGGINFIFFGAGLPLNLPSDLVEDCQEKGVSLVPIVSSDRAMKIICSRWQSRYNYLPDAFVLEGPLAGGHLGFKNAEEISNPLNSLENLLSKSLELVRGFDKKIKLIVAGGISSPKDIKRWLRAGASAVQMGTIFVATKESGASDEFKEQLLKCSDEDMTIAFRPEPESPCGLPFRLLKSSAGYLAAKEKKANPPCVACLCGRSDEGRLIKCPAIDDRSFFCICTSLLSAVGIGPGYPVFTLGANAAKVKENLAKIMSGADYPSVKEIMNWLAKVVIK
jgi:nitronate monooxygenase